MLTEWNAQACDRCHADTHPVCIRRVFFIIPGLKIRMSFIAVLALQTENEAKGVHKLTGTSYVNSQGR